MQAEISRFTENLTPAVGSLLQQKIKVFFNMLLHKKKIIFINLVFLSS